ncbi:MFS transporter [Aquabacterium sp.]|uniref:MFS transporter n=1 Tax=Aquabacterium sp. TaxID=1872578 RepID=UPI002C7D107A|nr:MFS transporter [Aquabacterium sp.]HSW06332.1 MFS transporter [Aquabacterium sp.]
MSDALPLAVRRLVGSNLAAQSAEQLSLAAVPIVAVLVLGAGPGEVGWLATAQTLPFLLLSIPLGLLADRGSRRRLMVQAEVLRALALLAMIAALLFERLSIGLLAALGFVGAIGTVAFSVAAPALVTALVPRATLAQANGRLELARSAAFIAGPALGGALVAWAGASAAFVLATMLSAAAALLLVGLREPERQAAAAKRHPWLELQDGARLVWRHALLRPILLTAVAWNISWFVLQAAYVPYAMRALGLQAGAVGLTLGSYGVGMTVGALLTPRLVAAIPFGRAILLGPAISVLAAATMVATLVFPVGGLAALSFFLFGAGPIVWTITSMTLRQTATPPSMQGRVSAIFLTVNAGARPLGGALGGLIGAGWGEPACLVLALAGFVVQALVIFGSPVRVLRQLPPAVA